MMHLVWVVRDVSYGDFPVRSDHQTTTFLFCLSHIFQLVVIHQMTLIHCLYHIGVFPQSNPHQRHQCVAFLHKAFWLRQDDHVPVVAVLFEVG